MNVIIKIRDVADYHFANNPAWVLAITVIFSVVVVAMVVAAFS